MRSQRKSERVPMTTNKQAAAIAAFVSIVCGVMFISISALRESRSDRLANEAIEIANEAKDDSKVGTWHLMIASTGPQVGMPVTLRGTESASEERAGILVRKVGKLGWMIAAFDEARAEWAIVGPFLEGTREELGTWTPAICGGMRPGFTGIGHEHAGGH